MSSYVARVDEARVIVGLDFGTTFSGYGYAHRGEPTSVCVFYEWPGFAEAGGKPYCKTQTALYYKPSEDGTLQFHSWGYQAQVNYTRDSELAQRKKTGRLVKVGTLVTRFKLHLADGNSGSISAADLPQGLTVKQVITDFLREIGHFIMDHLQDKFGKQLTLKELQWCVTVPSIWGDKAKQQMKSFMAGAGLVGGANGSPYPVVVVLEPEAAAVYCLKKLQDFKLNQGEKFLVADVGGGTSDIVVQEKANASENLQVKEVTASSGGLCGGSYVDQSFMKFMAEKIGCLDNFLVEQPSMKIQLLKWWENAKSTFNGRDTDLILMYQLSAKLQNAWEKYDTENGTHHDSDHDESSDSDDNDRDYSVLEITYDDLVRIFSGVVNENIKLIKAQLAQTSNIKVIMVVGGFATSAYLMSKIKEAFEPGIVVVSPSEPGRAICDGAVSIGFFPDNLVARVSRRTYGILFTEKFRDGVDPQHLASYNIGGVKHCRNRCLVYLQVGQMVDTSFSKQRIFSAPTKDATSVCIEVFSSPNISPQYSTDEGVILEGKFTVDISSSVGMPPEERRMLVTMFFGHSSIQVTAQHQSADLTGEDSQMLPVNFDWA